VDVALLYLDGCPHRQLAEERLRVALARLGRDGVVVRRAIVRTLEDAERSGFHGSPTILIQGRDPFAAGGIQPALACRLYATPRGLEGCPTVDQLVEALA
jgi:hypothetical protein